MRTRSTSFRWGMLLSRAGEWVLSVGSSHLLCLVECEQRLLRGGRGRRVRRRAATEGRVEVHRRVTECVRACLVEADGERERAGPDARGREVSACCVQRAKSREGDAQTRARVAPLTCKVAARVVRVRRGRCSASSRSAAARSRSRCHSRARRESQRGKRT